MTVQHPKLVATAFIWTMAATTPAVAAGNATHTYSSMNNLGDVSVHQSSNPTPLHLGAGFEARSADYFRGRYDGVGTAISDTELSPFASLSLDLPTFGLVKSLDLTGGSFTSFSTNTIAAQRNGHREPWYEANNFVGLSAQLDDNLSTAVTYADYTAPDDQFASSKEVAFSMAHKDPLHPQVKVAIPVDEGNGSFVRGDIKPSIKILKSSGHPVTLGVPLAVAAGFNDYYGNATGTPGFVSAGADASVALTQASSAYGHWELDAGVNVLARNHDLQDVNPKHNDTIIPIGMVKIAMVY